ncbi:MAG: hypothetical protein FD161_1225 [Limisphaerales bacterium]|nr:MAG: hypothetical protein FD161_1225 [Limisphaerales bacterium]TXT49495.1 MAG: hypothetical protein FD140_3027 [Limisphaerales bacterium]
MTQNAKAKTFFIVYVPALALSYLIAFFGHFFGGSTDLSARSIWACFLAIGTWIFTLPFLIGFVCLVGVFCERRQSHSTVWRSFMTSIAIIAIGCLWISHQFMLTTPKARFEKLVITPIPKSAKIARQGGLVTMDSEFWVLQFKIAKDEFLQLVNESRFVKEAKDHDLERWRKLIEMNAGISPDFTGNWTTYLLKEGRKERRLFFNESSEDAFFVLTVRP